MEEVYKHLDNCKRILEEWEQEETALEERLKVGRKQAHHSSDYYCTIHSERLCGQCGGCISCDDGKVDCPVCCVAIQQRERG